MRIKIKKKCLRVCNFALSLLLTELIEAKLPLFQKCCMTYKDTSLVTHCFLEISDFLALRNRKRNR